MATAAAYTALAGNNPVTWQGDTLKVTVPQRPLKERSLKVGPSDESKKFSNWTEADHKKAYSSLEKIAAIWENNQTAEDFLIYGKVSVEKESKFGWEMVPYHKKSWWFPILWQQFKVLWNISFGAFKTSPQVQERIIKDYQKEYETFPDRLQKVIDTVNEVAQGDDAFCDPDVIHRQCVFEGKHINILYDHAPIGIGGVDGEKLHFLFVPKTHRKTFRELTEEEYLEASLLSQLLFVHFLHTRPIKHAYLYHKKGIAGQKVKHFHLHMVLTTNSIQDWLGKGTVFKKMLFGSRPLPPPVLKKAVEKYKAELRDLNVSL